MYERPLPVRTNRHIDKCEKVLVSYHPMKDKWRIVDFQEPHGIGSIFVARGLFYCMDVSGILVYNFDKNSWRRLYYHSFTAVESVDDLRFLPCLALAFGNEILALGFWWDRQYITSRRSLLRGTVFAAKQTEIAWREVDCDQDFHKQSMYGIEL